MILCKNVSCNYFSKTQGNCGVLPQEGIKKCKYFIKGNINIGSYDKYGNITYSVKISQKPSFPNSYTFQGPINLYHLTNDCIKDQKAAFIAISPDSAIFGVSKQIQLKSLDEFRKEVKPTKLRITDLPFTVFTIPKDKINWTMKFADTLQTTIKRDIRKATKALHKAKKAGKFSNTQKTKVMVF